MSTSRFGAGDTDLRRTAPALQDLIVKGASHPLHLISDGEMASVTGLPSWWVRPWKKGRKHLAFASQATALGPVADWMQG